MTYSWDILTFKSMHTLNKVYVLPHPPFTIVFGTKDHRQHESKSIRKSGQLNLKINFFITDLNDNFKPYVWNVHNVSIMLSKRPRPWQFIWWDSPKQDSEMPPVGLEQVIVRLLLWWFLGHRNLLVYTVWTIYNIKTARRLHRFTDFLPVVFVPLYIYLLADL